MILDGLIMLLSTDWFKPYWTSIGIDADETAKNPIQQGCRRVVKQILSGVENYYDISFSDDRQKQTRSLLEAVVCGSSAEATMLPVVEKWTGLSDEEEKAAWMYAVLTFGLLSGHDRQLDTQLDRAIILIMAETQDKYELAPFEFAEICQASRTQWDVFTRGLTPDQPTLLADILASALTALRFEVFWNSLKQRLTATQRAELSDWYRRMAKGRAQRDLVLAYVT